MTTPIGANLSRVGNYSPSNPPGYTAPPATAFEAPRATPELPEVTQHGLSYYVATTGDDQKDGKSLDTAWRTLQHAVQATAPGDSILVAGGEYEGFFVDDPAVSGHADNWKSLRALDMADKPVINRPGAACPQNRQSGLLLMGTAQGRIGFWLFEGLIVRDAPCWGMDFVFCTNMTVRHCEAYDNGREKTCTGFFAAYVDYYWVENCYSQGNSEHGYYHNNSPSHFIYRNNVSVGNGGCGFHLNGDFDFGPPGLNHDGLYENNLAISNGARHGGASFNLSGLHHGVFRNNLAFDCKAGGLTFYQGNSGDTSRGIDVYRNTVVMSATTNYIAVNFDRDGCYPDVDPGQDYDNPFTGTPLNLRFAHNVICTLSDRKLLVEMQPRGGVKVLTEPDGVAFCDNLFDTDQAVATFDGAFDPALRARWLQENRFELTKIDFQPPC